MADHLPHRPPMPPGYAPEYYPRPPAKSSGGINATSLTLGAVNVIALCGAAIWATYVVVEMKNDIKGKFSDITRDVSDLRRVVEKVDSRIVGKTPERFHRRDADELIRAMCQATANASGKRIQCPNPYNLPGFRSRQVKRRQ